MRKQSLLITLPALVATLACGRAGKTLNADAFPIPATVNCADSAHLKTGAADARQRIAASTGDRARIIAGSQAKFAASLAIIAQLKCGTSLSNADSLLLKALATARDAATTSSEYDAAHSWAEADLIATDAVSLLIRQSQGASK